MKKIYILYGTQSGNAQEISYSLHNLLLEKEYECSCMSLNNTTIENDSFNFIDINEPVILIVVCSTYGNGDAPESANHFWRKIKNRKHPRDLFKNIKYAVMGLGDTNYDNFCKMGKNIDKRFDELGGERILHLHCADEAKDMETTVDAFNEKVLQFFSF